MQRQKEQTSTRISDESLEPWLVSSCSLAPVLHRPHYKRTSFLIIIFSDEIRPKNSWVDYLLKELIVLLDHRATKPNF